MWHFPNRNRSVPSPSCPRLEPARCTAPAPEGAEEWPPGQVGILQWCSAGPSVVDPPNCICSLFATEPSRERFSTVSAGGDEASQHGRRLQRFPKLIQ